MAQPDLSLFGKVMGVNDFKRLQDEFDAKKAQAAQAQQMNALQIQKAKQDLNAGPDIETLAQRSLYDYYGGKGMTPEGKAAIETLAAMKGDSVKYQPDPLTGNIQAITSPNPYRQFLGELGGGAPQDATVSSVGAGQPLPALQAGKGGYVNDIGNLASAEDVYATIAGEPMPSDMISAAGQSRNNAYATQSNVENIKPNLSLTAQTASPTVQRPQSRFPVGSANYVKEQADLDAKQYEQQLKMAEKDKEAQIKKDQDAAEISKGKQELNTTLEKMLTYISDIEKQGGGIKTGGGFQPSAYLAGTAAGKEFGKMTGDNKTDLMVQKDSLKRLLIPQIMKATGMSAKQLDSNTELKSYLDALSSDTTSIQAQREIIKNISDIFGDGKVSMGQAPQIGYIEDGYAFKGGDPANPQSWEKVQ